MWAMSYGSSTIAFRILKEWILFPSIFIDCKAMQSHEIMLFQPDAALIYCLSIGLLQPPTPPIDRYCVIDWDCFQPFDGSGNLLKATFTSFYQALEN